MHWSLLEKAKKYGNIDFWTACYKMKLDELHFIPKLLVLLIMWHLATLLYNLELGMPSIIAIF